MALLLVASRAAGDPPDPKSSADTASPARLSSAGMSRLSLFAMVLLLVAPRAAAELPEADEAPAPVKAEVAVVASRTGVGERDGDGRRPDAEGDRAAPGPIPHGGPPLPPVGRREAARPGRGAGRHRPPGRRLQRHARPRRRRAGERPADEPPHAEPRRPRRRHRADRGALRRGLRALRLGGDRRGHQHRHARGWPRKGPRRAGRALRPRIELPRRGEPAPRDEGHRRRHRLRRRLALGVERLPQRPGALDGGAPRRPPRRHGPRPRHSRRRHGRERVRRLRLLRHPLPEPAGEDRNARAFACRPTSPSVAAGRSHLRRP